MPEVEGDSASGHVVYAPMGLTTNSVTKQTQPDN